MPTRSKIPTKKAQFARPYKHEMVEEMKVSHYGGLGRAKILTEGQFEKAVQACDTRSYSPLRNKLMLYLSMYAALRSKEIANLHISDITDVEGKLTNTLNVTKRAAKYGKERFIPMNSKLKDTMAAYVKESGIEDGPLFYDKFGKQITPNAVQKQIKSLYQACGFKGARSHSGRRTFITNLARQTGTLNCSLVDVQMLAGHSSLQTTQAYIDVSPNAGKLVNLL